MKESIKDSTWEVIVILLICLFGLITINAYITDSKKIEEEDCNNICMSKIQFEIEELTEELDNCYQKLRDNEI